MTDIDLFGQKAQPVQNPPITSIDFNKVIGQEKVKLLLERAIINERINKAYLFYGPQGTGKDAMAIELGKALNCTSNEIVPCQTCNNCRLIGQLTHPDLKFLFAAPAKLKEGDYINHIQKKADNCYLSSAYSEMAGILIDQIRQLKKNATMKLYKGKSRIFIISEADRMTIEASNSLLKLLEEPPEHLILILTTSRLDKLLLTIISRCQVIKFAPLSEESIKMNLIENKIEPNHASVVSRLSMGNLQKAQQLLEENHQQLREQAWILLISSQSKDDLKKLDIIDEIAAGKDRGQIKELFLSALLWLRDVQVLQTPKKNGSRGNIFYNEDQIEKLEQLNIAFDGTNLEKAITETENSIDLVGKNVYITLIFINYVSSLFDNKL